MDGSFEHVPVLFDECMDGLNIKKDGIYVDCTAGGGGHSFGIVSRLGSQGKVISLDKDDEALATCEARKKDLKDGGEWILVKSDFKDLSDVLSDLNIEKADGILADLGVSSHQIDTPERGFSYGKDGPLDMRMDRSRSLSAAVVVNSYSKEALEKIFRLYGEERYAGRIADGIVRSRSVKPFETTLELADKIGSFIPGKARGEDQHPARRVFQALRIEVNGELDGLEKLLEAGVKALGNGGRFCVISFHSLEDRIVKEAFRRYENPCTCPREFPVCVCGKKPLGRVLTKKPITASAAEVERNSRAHCCKLRVFERNGEIWQ